MHQDQTVVTISRRNRQSPGRARRGTLSQPSHSSLQVSNEQPYGNVQVGTRISQWNWQILSPWILAERLAGKVWNTDLSSNGHTAKCGDWPGPVEGDIGGATANPMGSDGAQRMRRRLSARATARKGRTPPAKTWLKRVDSANGIDKQDRRPEKAEGMLRT